ncbi:uncharacterized protein LOC123564668 [Mercenaria mercenaria]|uniref:uncharacterized protein LOC123564668 n=1 Tax=Mercenaria mercenaria TaxID=6596 RepID=UPI00234EAB78|nr:uncharacterized protein LOC123564668 [Mercenaria mercenaria]
MEILQPQTEMEIKCVIGRHPLKKNELVVITKTTTMKHQRQYAKKTSIPLLCEQVFRQTLLLYMFYSFMCSLAVSGQPLQQPPEHFTCGPAELNVACERWGYDTCISDNGEFYCLPCSQEYLAKLCSTQEEMEGCNLFCTEKALDKETDKIIANFTEQLTYLQKQAEISKKEANFQAEKIKKLKGHIRNRNIAIYAIITALCIAVGILVCFIIWCIRQTRGKAKLDEENPETEPEPSVSAPPAEGNISDNSSENSEETLLKEFRVLPDSQENIEVSDNEEHDLITPEKDKSNVRQEKECPAINKLRSIPATNTKGNDKLAIKTKDHRHLDAQP